MSEQPVTDPDALSPNKLRDFGLFGALSEETLEWCAKTLAQRTLASGDVVFREGEEGRDFYLIQEGEVEIIKTTRHGHELRLSRIGVGQWFGDMSVLDVQRRFATVRAIQPCRLIVLSARDLDAMYRRDLKSYTLLVLNLARETSRRLRGVDELVFEMVGRLRDQHLGCG